MSSYTLARIPREVSHIFRVYENTVQLSKPFLDPVISSFLDKSNAFYDNFNQSKLRQRNSLSSVSYNPRDFPPVLDEAVARIFNEPLSLENELSVTSRNIPMEALLAPDSEVPLVSQKNKRTRNFSNYQARILSIFASYYTPHNHVPKSARASFAWYRRLLRNTPVIFFLRQKHLLMCQTSIDEQNLPLAKLEAKLNELRRQKYSTSQDLNKKTRNYHLTELDTPDLLALAIRGESATLTEQILSSPLFWKDLDSQDQLIERIRSVHEPMVLKNSIPVGWPLPSGLLKEHPISDVMKKIRDLDDVNDVARVFPFDVAYSGLHMLTIEASVFRDSHAELLDVLEATSDFDVYAIRMAKSAVSEMDFRSLPDSHSATYDQLIEHAKASKRDTHNSLLQRIGEWGLVSVEENTAGSAFYLLR